VRVTFSLMRGMLEGREAIIMPLDVLLTVGGAILMPPEALLALGSSQHRAPWFATVLTLAGRTGVDVDATLLHAGLWVCTGQRVASHSCRSHNHCAEHRPVHCTVRAYNPRRVNRMACHNTLHWGLSFHSLASTVYGGLHTVPQAVLNASTVTMSRCRAQQLL
jgi:hypothetical protein